MKVLMDKQMNQLEYVETAEDMIKALEEKNDGLFDYTTSDAVTCSR